MAIWIVQFVGQEIRVLDYIEGVGQVLAYYVNELHSRGYSKALCYLPHDGMNANAVTGLRYGDHLRDAGFDVTVIPNQGSGAAAMRIEAIRRLFPKVWFNEARPKPDALRSATTTKKRTRNATSVSARIMTGRAMLPMLSA
jgi:phage terminase large subunit